MNNKMIFNEIFAHQFMFSNLIYIVKSNEEF
jgi:hypothetical protein